MNWDALKGDEEMEWDKVRWNEEEEEEEAVSRLQLKSTAR